MNGVAHILLVSDDPREARVIQEQLCAAEGAGEFMITSVGTLQEALRCLEHGRVSMLMLDLPESDGGMDRVLEVTRHHPEVPIVVLTGSDDRGEGLRAVRGGVQDFLVKGRPSPESLRRVARYAIERKRAEKAERDLDLLRSGAPTSEALGVVAHELRTPLAALRACTELLVTEGPEAERQALVESIHQEVIRLCEMADNLLEAARLGSSAARWRWSRDVDLGAVCQGAIEVMGRIKEAGRVRLRSEVEPPGLSMSGDADALRRLLLNLLTNALRHTPAGGLIELRARERRGGAGRTIEIEVRDTGEGIAADALERIGQPFVLGGAGSGRGGLRGAGLGLAICKGIVAAHGGRLTLRSAPGAGTTVAVELAGDLPEPAVSEGELAIERMLAA
jgi:signal transduction histidine kinase